MNTFIACYLIVWVAVTGYVVHLGATQSSLRQQLDDLKHHLDNQNAEIPTRSRAA